MKNKITPTQHERVMIEGDFIVSKTDASGRITYCNEIFIQFSGYSEEELLGTQHNIVRHPDMPRGVFHFLWTTIKEGRECFAYVKNMAKDGSFYWVFANVTPDNGPDGRPVGYFSVRRKPRPEAVAIMSALYAELLAEEQRVGPRDAIDASLSLLTSKLNQLNLSYDEFILSI
ncbi:PAS domain-containing protein [Pontibacterium sp.]|uniref:PAS domain-containing protein n=1 Tax=Pontibacterium sp. TaxID=2036026 RepID=UPI00351356E0